MNNKGKVYFVSAIDTDAGKTYATGYLAKLWKDKGVNIITQKLVQTGNKDVSEDIEKHRKLMQIDFTQYDHDKITMPEIFTYPASPHLAAEIDKREINLEKINNCTEQLRECYDVVLLEGAGGLMVPLKRDLLTIDYVAKMGYDMIFVTSGKLGSINHTILSLEAIKSRGINLKMVVYNMFPTPQDKTIMMDTMEYIKTYLAKHFPNTEYIILPEL